MQDRKSCIFLLICCLDYKCLAIIEGFFDVTAPPCHLLIIIYIRICLHISKKSTTFAPKTLEYYY